MTIRLRVALFLAILLPLLGVAVLEAKPQIVEAHSPYACSTGTVVWYADNTQHRDRFAYVTNYYASGFDALYTHERMHPWYWWVWEFQHHHVRYCPY